MKNTREFFGSDRMVGAEYSPFELFLYQLYNFNGKDVPSITNTVKHDAQEVVNTLSNYSPSLTSEWRKLLELDEVIDSKVDKLLEGVMDEIEKYCTAALGLEVETEGAIKNISDSAQSIIDSLE